MPDPTPIAVEGQILETQTLPVDSKEATSSEKASSEKSKDAEKNSTVESDAEKSGEKSDNSLELAAEAHDEPEYLTGFRLITVVTCLMLAVFCVALDNTIVATAVPRITDDFHAIDDVGWYASAYLLTTCSFQILYAKFYTFFNVKWVFLTALCIFEIGSLLCGIAPSSKALIVGRAIAGLGSSGLYSGSATAIAAAAPVRLRPLLTGLLGGLFGFSSIIGPLMGGALTDKVTWRWCFYINLPIGAVTAIGILVFLRIDQKLEKIEGNVLTRIMQFDPIGNLCFICAVICLLVALQWGGSTYPYSDGRMIALFVLFGVLLIAFVSVQVWLGEKATIPTRIAKQRAVRFGALWAFCIGGAVFPVVYYLPVWFQAIQGVSPITSAIHTLPLILSQLFGTIWAGALTTRIGYYMPFVWLSAVLLPIGCGLLTTFSVDTPVANWIGYQILMGFGFGFGFQQATVAVQATLPSRDVATGVAIVFSTQFLGGTIFVSVAENLFANRLLARIIALDIAGLNAQLIVNAGATELRNLVPSKYLSGLLVAYDDAVTQAFLVGLIMSCLMVFGAVGIPWTSLKKKTPVADPVTEA